MNQSLCKEGELIMLVENHYYINVSNQGRFVFKVDPIHYPNQDRIFDLISSEFEKSQGYKVELILVKCS